MQSTGGSLLPPLLQNRACEATRTRLLRYLILVTDASVPQEAVGSDLWQLRTLRPIHTLGRDRSGVSGILTATHSDLLQAPASPSAYPGHYPRPWLLEGSLQHRHTGDPCSPRERTLLVTSFLMIVWRRCRAVLYTGFDGDAPWSRFKTPGPYPSPFGASLRTHVGLFRLTMLQPDLRLRCPWRPARRDDDVGFIANLLFTPLYHRENQSQRQG